jgi:large subunit ribosomal protein L23
MTVELERPFVWPEEPEDFSEWNKAEMEDQDKEQQKMSKKMEPTGDTIVNEERRERMREQARALLEGRVRWKPVAGRNTGGLLSR